MKVLKIPTIEELKEIDLSYMKTISQESGVIPQVVIDNELGEPPGVVPYPLYAHFSTTFDNGVILDLGTLFGGSALAAAYNPTNHVISYEIVPHIEYNEIKKDNITWKLMDFRDDDTIDFDKVKSTLYWNDEDPQNAFIRDSTPFETLAWVLNLRLSLNLSVPKGSKIITGSVIKTRIPSKGDKIIYSVGNLSETQVVIH